MTVRLDNDGAIRLVNVCPAEDAESLLQLLLEHPDSPIDWNLCRSAHTSVIQVLLVASRAPAGSPPDAFLGNLIGPALARSGR
jgi:hypothetical protein